MRYSVFIGLAAIGLIAVGVLAVNLPYQVGTSITSEVNAVKIIGSGILKTESRPVSNFTAIDISGSYDVEIVAQQAPSLEISGDDNILPLIITEIRGNTLFIYISDRRSIFTKNKLKIKTSSQTIESISASGATNIKLTNVNSENLSINQSGGSYTYLLGKTRNLNIKISGAGDVNAKNLYSQTVKVDISGAASADVYASEKLNTRIVGAGEVNYYGNPKTVTRNIVGVGSIKKK